MDGLWWGLSLLLPEGTNWDTEIHGMASEEHCSDPSNLTVTSAQLRPPFKFFAKQLLESISLTLHAHTLCPICAGVAIYNWGLLENENLRLLNCSQSDPWHKPGHSFFWQPSVCSQETLMLFQPGIGKRWSKLKKKINRPLQQVVKGQVLESAWLDLNVSSEQSAL